VSLLFLLIVLALGLGFDWQKQSAGEIRQHNNAKPRQDGEIEPEHRPRSK
jgi:hypothetical protein